VDEREWLTECIEEHWTRLRELAYRMLGSLGEADDAAQGAWLASIRPMPAALTTTMDGRPGFGRSSNRPHIYARSTPSPRACVDVWDPPPWRQVGRASASSPRQPADRWRVTYARASLVRSYDGFRGGLCY
jgi:hypothetical protein